jgi:hypothetical protein
LVQVEFLIVSGFDVGLVSSVVLLVVDAGIIGSTGFGVVSRATEVFLDTFFATFFFMEDVTFFTGASIVVVEVESIFV